MRVNLSVAIVAMVNHTAINEKAINAECPNLIQDRQSSNEVMNYKGEKYNWNSKTQGWILGSYYYGYVTTQIPGGVLAEKIGAKWVFGGGVLATSVFSLLSPLAASLGTTAFICVRVLQGLADGVTSPSINVAISKWAPKMERSRVSTIIFTGIMIGDVLALTLSGLLCSSDKLGGWPSVFYLFGGAGVIWCIFWFSLMHETPGVHPTISKQEQIYIEQNQEDQSNKKLPIPWREILTSSSVWAFAFAMFGHNFGYLMLLAELPTYLSTILHYDLASNGFLSAIPFILQCLSSWIASAAADRLRKSEKISITFIRKLFNSIGMVGPAICLLAVTQSGCRPELIVALFSIGMAFDGCIFSGYNVTHVDMSPNFSGTLYGIANTISCLTGFISPMVVGVFLESGATMANWSKVLYTTVLIYIFFAIMFLIFASAELQSWNSEKVSPKQECKMVDGICVRNFDRGTELTHRQPFSNTDKF
ncbi:sialin-like isoform X2 [Parasteatoda tepidariorum]